VPDDLPLLPEMPDQVGVLVIGGGLAGAAALLSAAESGQFAVLLEGSDDIGGSTVRSAGLSAFAGTEEQAAQGIEDSVALLRHDLLTTGRNLNQQELVELYCDEQLATYQWLREHRVVFGEVHAAAGQSVPRSHPTDSTRLLHLLMRDAGKLGARVALRTKAVDLELASDGERVLGAVVEMPDGGRRSVRADAVVLATGGFSRNPELLSKWAPHMSKALAGGAETCQGDGLLMGLQLGAGLVDTEHVRGTYGIYPEAHPDEDGTGILAVYKGAVAINRAGRRFVNESLPYKVLGDASLAQVGGTTYQVFDSQVLRKSTAEVPIYDFAGRRNAGLLLSAASLASLADEMGVPQDAVVNEISAYNAAITAGEPDRFGRTHLSGDVGDRVPLVEPPFYAHLSGTSVLATYCGLTVDSDMRVLREDGEPIPRLYAAGEVVGGLHGGGYMTGSAIGKAAIFGRVAGRAAAEEPSDLTW